MKKRLILMCMMAVAISLAAHAQEKKQLSLITSVGTGLDISTPAKTPVNFHVIGLYGINSHLYAGAGTGISSYEKMLIPVFTEVRYYFTKPKTFMPFAECNLGYSFAPDKHANGGLYLNPSIGMQYKQRFFVSLGCEWQKLERLKSYKDQFASTEFAEKLHHTVISVNFGYKFDLH
ncbi:MAG: hypothetical protein LKI18_08610 [Prevotella sp.]|nr:hypothetical protein [Prevotella sp.]